MELIEIIIVFIGGYLTSQIEEYIREIRLRSSRNPACRKVRK